MHAASSLLGRVQALLLYPNVLAGEAGQALLQAWHAGSDAAAWFEYRPRCADEWRTTEPQQVSPGEQYCTRLTDLQSRTIYEYRAVCEGPDTEDIGDRYTVRTDRETNPGAITVETAAPASVGPTVLTLCGTLRSNSDLGSATMWVEYRLEGFSYWHRTEPTTVEPGDRIDRRIDDLAPATTYEYRVGAEIDDNTLFGTVRTATTAAASTVPRHVVLNCYSTTDVGPTAIRIDADIHEIVGADAATIRIEYRCRDADEWQHTDPTTVGTYELYDERIDGLEPETTYEFRAAAEVGDGWTTSETRTVTTEPGDEAS